MEKELLNIALDECSFHKVEYADVRLVERLTESISIKNGEIEEISKNSSLGMGIRVLANGAWGFAATNQLDRGEIIKTAQEAVTLAKSFARTKKERVIFSSSKPRQAKFKTSILLDPFSIPLSEKVSLLMKAEKNLHVEKEVKIGKSFAKFKKERKIFATTEGSFIEQEIYYSGGGLEAYAIARGEMQRRSYPNSHGNYLSKGYEYIKELNLPEKAVQVGEEAVKLLHAPNCPEKVTTVVIDSSQMALQIHESVGHPLELDRILGMEISLAGESFVKLPMINKFKYGSEIINIEADATFPGGLGTFGFDDDGVEAQKFPLVREGILVNALTNRETAHFLGKESNGTCRADGFNRFPIIRMTNINLLPGEKSLEEIISEVKEGLFLSTVKSWSIDNERLNFQFTVEWAQEIKEGKLGKVYKNANYTGITPNFWHSCDAVADEKSFSLWGFLNCGKGDPMQIIQVSHGSPAARIRNVQTGVAR
jgi:TldD protein